MIPRSSLSLRTLLWIDAATCAGFGAILALGSREIGALVQISPGFLLYVGLALLPMAAVIAIAAWPRTVDRRAARLVVAGNVLWVAASVVVVIAGWVEPNAVGLAFIAGQAVAVAVLAAFEYGAARTSMVPALGA
jgi:hypothetical protein